MMLLLLPTTRTMNSLKLFNYTVHEEFHLKNKEMMMEVIVTETTKHEDYMVFHVHVWCGVVPTLW